MVGGGFASGVWGARVVRGVLAKVALLTEAAEDLVSRDVEEAEAALQFRGQALEIVVGGLE